MRKIHKNIFKNDFARKNKKIDDGYISMRALSDASSCNKRLQKLNDKMFDVIFKSDDYVKIKPLFFGYCHFIIECYIENSNYIIKTTNLNNNKYFIHDKNSKDIITFCKKAFR